MEFNTKPFFCQLNNRGLIKVGGEARYDFLQGLITNDINLLKTQNCVYSCLLTPQGKFLHDFFMTEHDEEIWLDCEGGARAEDLKKRLMIYKLRAKVTLDCDPDYTIYACLNLATEDISAANIALYKDPRHEAMGYRAYDRPETLPEDDAAQWDHNRIYNTVPDGSRDMPPELSTLMDYNIDRLNGVSFDKGCFIGQELTARMNYRGLVKKRLRTIKFTAPDTGTAQNDDGVSVVLNFGDDATLKTVEGKKAGNLLSHNEAYGLAMLRNDAFVTAS